MKRLILVSNRLPTTIEKNGNSISYNQSVGGLATGLSSVSKNYQCLWLGFPGIVSNELSENEKIGIKEKLNLQYKSYPVFLNSQEYKSYYNGFCNKTIWPLFHYFQYYTNFEKTFWESYISVNKIFFEELIKIVNQDDLVWIHDYQLMLLPKMIKEKFPSIRIGFFLHIPFPSFEILRLLPWDREILEGILGADLVAFHTFSYVRHFLGSVRQVLGYENTFGQINTGNRVIKVDTIPMGIDYDKFANSPNDPKVKKEIKLIQKSLPKQRIILSIDRLDYTKGLVERLEAFDLFLTKYPDYIGKVTLVMVAVPSRTKVDSYNELKNLVDETVGRINGKYSKIGWTPIKYIYRSLNFQTLCAFYSVSDIALITPVRDGMNLIAKEFIASKSNKKGVLILSEMAGVSEELGEAFIVNPNDKDEIADALNSSLNAPLAEQNERIRGMQERLKRNDVYKWASLFIERLENTKVIEEKLSVKILDDNIKKNLITDYKNSKKRLFLLDYDGTLTGFTKKIDDAKPDKELYQIIDKLIKEPKNRVVIISGRNRESLEKFWGKYNLTLISEHGVWMKYYNKEWKITSNLNMGWKSDIMPILESYVDRTPKSFIENKSYSLAWHYRSCDPDLASIRLKEMKVNLMSTIANLNLGIIDGNNVIEIRNPDINKGEASNKIINEDNYDFILAAGDDTTDEDIFSILPNNSYSIKIGLKNSMAKYNLNDFTEMRKLLKSLED